MLDASAGGSIKWKTPTEARELIENMASNDNEVHNERAQSQQKGVLQLQSHDALLAQNKIMTQQLEALMKKLSQLPQDLRNVSQTQHQQQLQNCELCGGDHPNGQCAMKNTSQEEVNYMGNTSCQGNYNHGLDKQGPQIDHHLNNFNNINIPLWHHTQSIHASVNLKPQEHRSYYS